MESTAFTLFFSSCLMIVFMIVGVIAGWHINDVVYSMTQKNNSLQLHPEMYDDDGIIINEELLSVRFVDEEDAEEDDYY